MISFKERAAAAYRLLEIVERIAKRKEVRRRAPLAYRGLIYLAKNAHLCEPVAREIAPMDYRGPLSWRRYATLGFWRRQQPLGLLPLFAADQELNTFWREWYEQTQCCTYAAHSHVITVRLDMNETETFAACCLLHELGHALRAEAEGRARREANRTLDQRIGEEVDMYDFERELYRALGGSEYETILQESITLIRQAQEVHTPLVLTEVLRDKVSAMTAWLGAPPSELALLSRTNILAVHAYGLYCEQLYSYGQAQQNKFNIMKELLSQRYQQQDEWLKRHQPPPPAQDSP